jgi:GT2 family glycosyltransferase
MGDRVAVIIPTRNRPGELLECLYSLRDQSHPPELVVACDSSDTEETRMTCRRMAQGNVGFELLYRRSCSQGASVQRNLAIELVPDAIDYVLLADDDVVFHPDYVRLLSGVFSADHGRTVAGAAGVARREGSEAPRWLRGYSRLFLLGGRRAEGRVLASGVNVAPPSEGDCVEADWLFGCAMYRRSVFAQLRFAEELAGYSLYDDVDFSMRARAAGRLVVCPKARVTHNRSPRMRPDICSAAAMEVTNRYWLVRRHAPFLRNRFAYWWSIVGLLILDVVRSLARQPGSFERLRGMVRGVRAILDSKGRAREEAASARPPR